MKQVSLMSIILCIQVYCLDDVDFKLNYNGLIRKNTSKKKNQIDIPKELFVSKVYTNIFTRQEVEAISSLSDFTDGDSKYMLQKRIGSGAFSDVYLGKSVKEGNRVVLKILNSIRQSIINREIAILSYLQGASPYIVKMVDAVRYPQNSTATIVYEYMDSIVLKKIANKIDFEQFKSYFYQLLLAVDASHKRGVIHRDIKLGNAIVNEKTKHLLLIDWGQADFYYPLKRMNCGIGTIHYKAPELLLNFSYYDYAADMFSIGAVLAGQVFWKTPFFKNPEKNNTKLNYLKTITKYLGTEKLINYMKKYKIEVSQETLDFIGQYDGISWYSIKLANRTINQSELAIDLVSKLIIFDHKERLTAEEALNHPFFDSIRRQFYQEKI